ncbi:hypothetical protein LTR92_011773, partial [Exophiala xenobiotica]
MVPTTPEADLRRDSNPLVEGLFNFHFIHIKAYVVHVDMVLHHEVAFKLTKDTIDSLVEYHTDFFLVDSAAETCSWAKKEQQLERLRENFVQAVNKYIYSTNVHVLEGMPEAEGAGELLCGRNDEVRAAIMRLYVPLLPSLPSTVDVDPPSSRLTSYMGAEQWQTAPVEAWTVAPSNLNPISSCGSSQSIWSS